MHQDLFLIAILTQKICDKAVNNHSSTIQFVPESYKTQEVCDKAFNNCFIAFTYISDRYKTQEICEAVIYENHFSIEYVPGQYETQEMCDEAVNDCLTALKFIPDWFFIRKMLEKLNNAFHANDDTLFYNEDFDKVKFIAYQRHILASDLDEIKLDNDDNFYEDHTNTNAKHL